ncbi:hypothetical protein BZG36_04442 [Bifiguratus adelaidae]|uniref:ethanolamine kinase n=1 Tax=Bifiguratus adelaidae TaxID=1938954 RepID=A0A261XVI0_9FUNG|nr:hypothetical protein BZG36_04442 [Bifiguratus adelaidae]
MTITLPADYFEQRQPKKVDAPTISPTGPPTTQLHLAMDKVIAKTLRVDVTISHDALFGGASKACVALFPHWKETDLAFVQCKDGITNKLIRVTHEPTQENVLVRAYGKGSEHLIDRRREIINILTLSGQGLAPPLYGRFNNGLIYGYIPGEVFSLEDMRDKHKSKLIAQKLAKWHKVRYGPPISDGDSDVAPELWATMWKWLKQGDPTVPAQFADPNMQKVFIKHFDMKLIRQELVNLQKRLDALNAPVVFGHNDLLYGNIVYEPDKDEASFIDYEYGSYSYRGFDIGNHFNEYAGNVFVTQNYNRIWTNMVLLGFECDYTYYPSKSAQLEWFKEYLTSSGEDPTPETIESLYHEVNEFALASHFYWGLWALVQADHSDIDFDYIDYARLRFEEYRKRA